MTDSHTQQRGSDWIDVIWAAHENALCQCRAVLRPHLVGGCRGTAPRPHSRSRVSPLRRKLKTSFNKTTLEGGFWDRRTSGTSIGAKGRLHLRQQPGHSRHFAAIGYGLCDDAARRNAILERMEAEMRKENLLFWPLKLLPLPAWRWARRGQLSIPKYENGDIFLSWASLRSAPTPNPTPPSRSSTSATSGQVRRRRPLLPALRTQVTAWRGETSWPATA